MAVLASIDPKFPMHLWCRLLKQAEMTLNMMRASRVHPTLSAYQELHGAFDFSKTPLAPIGIRVIVHEKLMVHKSWATHGVDGWYLGPAMKHYMYHSVYITKTRGE